MLSRPRRTPTPSGFSTLPCSSLHLPRLVLATYALHNLQRHPRGRVIASPPLPKTLGCAPRPGKHKATAEGDPTIVVRVWDGRWIPWGVVVEGRSVVQDHFFPSNPMSCHCHPRTSIPSLHRRRVELLGRGEGLPPNVATSSLKSRPWPK